ncbi:hypothetical protein [Streptomyces sp. NPDC051561]|uniref:hypothetical protein n=1 Tax=Streptomyces sp. NPDC051561 TaxID=3365658 RepID=UPI0037931698
MQQHRAHLTRPAAVVLSALLAVLALFLPVQAKSASAHRSNSTGMAAAATVQAAVSADAQRPVTVARSVLVHADAVPYPFHPFLGPGAEDAVTHRAVGGPAVAVAAAVASRGVHAYRPRGPPSRRSTEVPIDA